MPKYTYKCKECEDIFEISHSMSERLTDCEKCNTIESLIKVPVKVSSLYKDNTTGKVVEKHIEEAKRDLEEEKRNLEKKEM